VPVGTTAQRPTGAAGHFRYNTTLEQFEGYTDDWGQIGGGGGANAFATDSYTGDGSTTAYALSQVVVSEDNLLVFIEGVFQQQDAYSIATAGGTTTLTFSAAPANGNDILIYSVVSAISGTNLNSDTMTGDGSDTTLTLSLAPVNENNTQVYIDGVYQNKDTYSISGTTLTFSAAPPNGSAVEVMTMNQLDINTPTDGSVTPAKIASGDFYFDTDTLYVDATNNRVGIGVAAPEVTAHVSNAVAAGSDNLALRIQNPTNAADARVGIGFHVNAVTGAGWDGAYIQSANTGSDSGDLRFGSVTNNTLTERMRIDSSGNLLVGQTSAVGIGGTPADVNGTEIGKGYINLNRDDTADARQIQFGKNGSVVGHITTDGSATSYNTSSDQRLKENIADADDAGSKVDSIQVRKFDWIADGSHQDYGMVAQELQTVAPEAVYGDGDSDEMMGVDYSKLVPMLVKEIQSLRARVAQLENN
jgi:hypothetical protein